MGGVTILGITAIAWDMGRSGGGGGGSSRGGGFTHAGRGQETGVPHTGAGPRALGPSSACIAIATDVKHAPIPSSSDGLSFSACRAAGGSSPKTQNETNERTNERTNGENERTNGRTNKETKRTNEQTNGENKANERTNERTKRTNERTKRTNERTNGG